MWGRPGFGRIGLAAAAALLLAAPTGCTGGGPRGPADRTASPPTNGATSRADGTTPNGTAPDATAHASAGQAGAGQAEGNAARRTGAAPDAAAVAAVLIGAGDIATCEGSADNRTAALVAAQPGTVFTLGDNAYPDAT